MSFKISVKKEYEDMAKNEADILDRPNERLIKLGIDYLNTKEQVDVINAIRTLRIALESIDEALASQDTGQEDDDTWTGKDAKSRGNDLRAEIKRQGW